MVDSIALDPNLFSRHIEDLVKGWTGKEKAEISSADALFVVNGRESSNHSKTRAFQSWLFCYELTDTLIAITREKKVVIYCASLKVRILEKMREAMTNKTITLEIIKRDNKDDEPTKEVMRNIIKGLNAETEARKIAVLKGELKQGGERNTFPALWDAVLSESGAEVIDATVLVSDLLCHKDEHEQKCLRTSATITVTILKKFVLNKIEDVIDDGSSVTHADIAREAEDLFNDPKKISEKLQPEVVEGAYGAIVQSGGHYNLALYASNTSHKLAFDTIICSIGTKYKQYCSDIARTYFVDPSKSQEENYSVALAVHEAVIAALRPGATLGAVYAKGLEVVKEMKPELASKFAASFGFAIGLEFCDALYQIEAGNKRHVREGMAFDVRVALDRLSDSSDDKSNNNSKSKAPSKSYAILLADTVLIGDKENAVLTNKCTKDLAEISYEIGSEEMQVEEISDDGKTKELTKKDFVKKSELSSVKFSLRKDEELQSVAVGSGKTKRDLRNTTQRDLKQNASSAEAQRAEHQQQLLESMIEQAKKSLNKKSKHGSKSEETTGASTKEFTAYASHREFPVEVQRDTIYVDTKKECVVLPIHGQMVPFHIQTVRTVTKTDDMFLRIQFKHPGGGNLPSDKLPEFVDDSATFVKGLTYRITNITNLNNAYRLIMDLKKRTTQRDAELKQKQSLKEQPVLQLAPQQKVFRLPNLRVRPVMGNAKTSGTLETHANGFRFNTKKGVIDIIYSNIKNAIFQPCEPFSPIVALHFRLHNDIMVGKKKTQDIQFYAEIVEMSLAVSGPSKRSGKWGDNEEIEEEARERQMKAKLNQDFRQFTKKIEEVTGGSVQVEVPYKELGFTGVPGKNNILIQPTINCLVHVIETPFFVISLEDIQIAYFERVQFSLKNFDLVFVFKDWSQKEVRISAIPVDSLESLKQWLDGSNIKYYQGKANMDWSGLLNRISQNPAKFWNDGGWNILIEQPSDDTDSSSSDGDPEAGDYRPSGSSDEYDDDSSDFSSDSDDSGGSETDFSDEDDLASGSESDSGEDEGMDWDELEKKATRDDLKRRDKRGDSDDEREAARPVKKQKTTQVANKPGPSSLTVRKPSNAINLSGSGSGSTAPKPSGSLFGAKPGVINLTQSKPSGGAKPAASGNKPAPVRLTNTNSNSKSLGKK